MKKENTIAHVPEWTYPLYKPSDKAAYEVLMSYAQSKKYPKLLGSQRDIRSFLKYLVLSQRMKASRAYRDEVIQALTKDVFNVPVLAQKGALYTASTPESPAWAIFMQDRRLCKLLNEFQQASLEFAGTARDVIEFVVRFLLSQLLVDWRGPKMAVVVTCLKKKLVSLTSLNTLLRTWDYTHVFG